MVVDYPAVEIAAALADPGVARYRPEARGLLEARRAIGPDPDRIVLTSSTSEAYGWVLKLLCDPGDVVLVPEPSYPLFEFLVALEGVRARPYRLAWDGEWHVDFATVDAAGAKAILVVNPGNPTGTFLARGDLERLASTGLPIVSDEVFAPYPFADAAPAPISDEVLSFRLGGLSKGSGLPQLKLGWIVVDGPGAQAREALDRLELIADTYLSVSTPIMLAAPRLLEIGAGIRARILARVRENRATLAAAAGPFELLRADAGWSAILRFPRTAGDEAMALHLLEDHGVLVHPGYFFDLPLESCLVVSLIVAPDALARGLDAILRA